MKDATGRDIEAGDLVLIHVMSGTAWSWVGLGILDGTRTPGGKPRYMGVYGRRDYAHQQQIIKITPEFARELYQGSKFNGVAENKFEEFLAQYNEMQEI
jgi:hypothetical protein